MRGLGSRAALWFTAAGVLLALVAAALRPAPALAITNAWTGLGADANWSTPGNWTGGTPVAGQDLSFPFPLASQPTNNNDLPDGTIFNSIMIGGAGYTLNGHSVAIAASGSVTATYLTGGTSTINLGVTGNGTSINVTQTGSTLVFGGGVDNLGNITKAGPGTAVLLATGNPGLGWTVNAGILNVQNGGALGAHFLVINPVATLQVQGGITLPTFMILGGGAGAANATGALESVSGSNTLTGGISLLNSSTVSVDAGASLTVSTNPVSLGSTTLTANVAGPATIASVIQNTGGLTKSGTGVLTLAGANTYTGPTAITAGTLLVNGSQSTGTLTTVSAGATLGGTGTAGPVTTSGMVSPGVNGPGILNSGAVSFNAGSTFAVDLDGTTAGSGYDRLIAAGTVVLGGNAALNVTVGFPSAAGNTYTIIQSLTVVAGTFTGLPSGATLSAGGRTFVITYTTNTVVLTDTTPTPTPTGTPTAASSPTGTPTPAGIPGDFNHDGFVDIRDYGVWRQNFGQANCGNPADANGDCLVDIRDYGIWRQHFGEGTPADRPGSPLRAEIAPAPRGTPSPTLLAGDQATAGSGALSQADGPGRAAPVIPLVGGLLGLGGLAGWRSRRRPARE